MKGIKIDYLGYVFSNILETIEHVKLFYNLDYVSEIFFDKLKNVHLRLIELKSNALKIKLVSGEPIKSFFANGITFYHLYYEVEIFLQEIEIYEIKNDVKPEPYSPNCII